MKRKKAAVGKKNNRDKKVGKTLEIKKLVLRNKPHNFAELLLTVH